MVISVCFSVTVYHLSTEELNHGFSRQQQLIDHLPSYGLGGNIRNQLMNQHERDVDEANNRIITRLVITNLLILMIGGILSYYLARSSLKPIEDAHEAQSRFTADASHELRTPLAAMQTEIEVALMKPRLKLSEAKEQLKSNLDEIGKLNQLTDRLLRLARLDHNGLNKEKIEIQKIINLAMTRLLPTAEVKHILIEAQNIQPLRVVGDETSLIELLMIILDNAIKYSPPKSQIELTVKKQLQHAVITINDHGIGIKDVDQGHIFDRFYRADSARNKNHLAGYGLGLAMAKSIVDHHAGQITVNSVFGQGSVFTVRLPLAT